MDTTNAKGTTASGYLPLNKTTVLERSLPRISYTALTSNSAIFNSDVQINSTIKMSSSQLCNQSFSSIDYPTIGLSPYFTKNTPKTAVNEKILPLESSVTDCFKTLSSNSEVPAMSFEKHFLWDTSLFCSQTRLINQETVLNPTIDAILHLNQQDSNTVDDDDKRIIKPFNNENYTNQSNYRRKSSTSPHKKSFIDELNATHSTIKPNPYSIEEILKKPNKSSKLVETIHPNVRTNDYEKPNLASFEYNSQFNDLSSLHRRSRFKFKIYDMNV